MLVSIIIVNWNTKDFLHPCLQSILDNPPTSDFEIIVVDNASSDSSAEMVRDEFPGVTLIANVENTGYAEGNNIGFSAAKGDILLLLNPDTEVRPGAIDALIRCMERHPDAGAVAGRLIYPDGRVQSSCRSFPEPMSIMYDYLRLSRLFPKSKRFGAYRMTWFDYNTEIEVDQPMASCMLTSRNILDEIGVFDTDLPIFFNDVDWCYRTKQKGFKIYFTPYAEIVHHVGGSTRQIKPAMVRESHISLKRFYAKHYKNKISPILYYLIMAAISVNMFISLRLKPIVKR